MWQGAASAMWGAQQSPPAPAPSFKIPTPAKLAPQHWYPPAGPLPPVPSTSVGGGDGGHAASQVHPGFFGIATLVANRNNGYLAIRPALTLVGKKRSDLPTIAEHVCPKGNLNICWAYLLLGRCPYVKRMQELNGTRAKECAHQQFCAAGPRCPPARYGGDDARAAIQKAEGPRLTTPAWGR